MLDCLKNVCEAVKDFFRREWTVEEKILIILCCVMFGMIKGFLIAPIKRGISCGNNNGNVYNELEDEYWLDDEEQAGFWEMFWHFADVDKVSFCIL